MAGGGGTTSGGAFRYPYSHNNATEALRAMLVQAGLPDSVVTEWGQLETDRERALEDYLTVAASGGLPFVVVAADGTGNYTSIKTAIEAAPATTLPYIIYVKPNGTLGYWDDSGAGTVQQPSGTQIFVIGAGAQNVQSSGRGGQVLGGAQVSWQFDQISTAGGSAPLLYFHNMNMFSFGPLDGSAILPPGASVGWTLIFSDCALTGIGSGLLYGTTASTRTPAFYFYNSNIGTTLFHNTGSATMGVSGSTATIRAYGSTINGICSSAITAINPAAGVTASMSWEFVDCAVSQSNNLNVSSNGAASTSVSPLIFQDCQLTLSSGITVNLTNGAPILITGCTSPTGTLPATAPVLGINLATTAQNTKRRAIIHGNDLMQVHLNVALLSDLGRTSVSGNYRKLTIGTSNCTFFGHINPQASGDSPAISIPGDNNSVFGSAANFGGAAVGVSIPSGGDNNIVIMSGLSNFGTPSSNSGSGNSINGLPPNGSAAGALSGTYPNPDMGGPFWMTNEGAPATGPRSPQPSVFGDVGSPGKDQTPARIDHTHDRGSDTALHWMIVSP